MGDDQPHGQFAPSIGQLHNIGVDQPDKAAFYGVVVAHERHRHRLALSGGELVNAGEVSHKWQKPVRFQVNGVHQDQLLVPNNAFADDGGNEPPGGFRYPAVDGVCCIAGISSVDRLD